MLATASRIALGLATLATHTAQINAITNKRFISNVGNYKIGPSPSTSVLPK